LSRSVPESLRLAWETRWPEALAVWSRYTRLRMPLLCVAGKDARKEGLAGSFAMIRLADQAIVVDLEQVVASRLEDYAVEVLAHEIGHHVYAPATLTDHGRMLARMRHALPTVEQHAPLVANLYTDLFINDRLQRSAGLRMGEVYRLLATGEKTGALWALYMRIYEHLWRLDRGALGGGGDDRLEGDALLAARLVRSYAREHVAGAGRFAAMLLPYLLEDRQTQSLMDRLFDTRSAGAGGEPAGLTQTEPGEREGAIHPADDPDLVGEDGEEGDERADAAASLPDAGAPPAAGQSRQPFEFGELLRAAGIPLDDHEAAIRYYREQALPHLVPYPTRRSPATVDPLPEGLEPWDIGDPIDTAVWMESILQSPRIVPGMTTVRRVWGTSEGHDPQREPLDLDLYVDSSGSMANPQRFISYPALAGAIVCLSALRAGASVQATLWSGPRQFVSTPGFVRDERAILRVLTGYFGGGTAFPIHVLRDTFANRRADARPAHILIISDDGVTTLYDQDEQGNSGWDVAGASLARAGGGGTMVLNLPDEWERLAGQSQAYKDIRRARDTQGWAVHAVATWEGLVAFGREFSRLRYGEQAPADLPR
jgi:hypothetical protein